MDPNGAMNRKLVAGVIVGAAVAAGLAVVLWKRGPAPSTQTALNPPAQSASAQARTPPSMPPIAVADKALMDAVAHLSTLPQYAQWLKVGDLARKFVSTVNAVADGRSPREQLLFLAPSSPFAVTKSRHRIEIDSKSYERYNTLADVVDSIDAPGAARVYGTVHGILSAAYGEIAPAGSSLDDRLASALNRLISTPLPKEPVRVIDRNKLYMFADESLESLPAASKCLIRMGPRNEKLIQAKLDELVTALHLPAPVTAKVPATTHGHG